MECGNKGRNLAGKEQEGGIMECGNKGRSLAVTNRMWNDR